MSEREELIKRLQAHLRQLAPHVKERDTGQLLTDCLSALTAQQSQPVPVEPEYLIRLRNALKGFKSDGAFAGDKDIVDYIDSLQSALQVAQQERDEHGKEWARSAEALVITVQRAEKAESELAALKGRLMEPENIEKAAHQDWCRWWNHGDMCSCGAMSAVALKEGK